MPWPGAASAAPPWPPWSAAPALRRHPRPGGPPRRGPPPRAGATGGVPALKANHAELDTIAGDLVPGLTSRPGIGPVSAARAIVSFSHHGRCRHDAAFARLAGTSPIEASSGQTTRHRLNRGGDRALNRAIHIIATTRIHDDPAIRAYLTRRRAEGKTDREIRRCLKRYIARQLYRTLTTAMTPAARSSSERSCS